MEGGTKSNVIAGSAFVHWSARLAPGQSNEAFLAAMQGCADSDTRVDWEVPFQGEPLPAGERGNEASRDFALANGLDPVESVDFWTEAALFSAAGLPSLVLGPGHIEQAHVADEWVSLDQLERACDGYRAVVKSDG